MDDIPTDLTSCWVCGALHFNPHKPCPDCSAGQYHQCSTPKGGGKSFARADAAEAYKQTARRLRQSADKYEQIARTLAPADTEGRKE
jgi:hypothetical protein